MNRMHETVRGARLEGEILIDNQNILAQDVTALRRRVGMVFQRPNPFPKSIFEISLTVCASMALSYP